MTTTPEARPEWEPVGYFSELKSAMAYRLWEQGGHGQQRDEVPLYSPAVQTEMLRAQEEARVLREALEESHALNVNWVATAEPEHLLHLSEHKTVIAMGEAALGTSAGCTPDASLEFMQHVPAEIRATITAQAARIAELEKDAGWVAVTERMPQSGLYVLACYTNSLGNTRRIRAYWTLGNNIESGEESEIGVYDEAADAYFDPEGWYESIDNWADYTAVAVTEGVVTHWMPLPPLPAATQQGERNE